MFFIEILTKSELVLLNSCQAAVKQLLGKGLFGHTFMTSTRRLDGEGQKTRQKLRTDADAGKRAGPVKTSICARSQEKKI